MSKPSTTSIRKLARARDLSVLPSTRGTYLIVGHGLQFGPADYETTRLWLAKVPTLRSRLARKNQGRTDASSNHARAASGYWDAIFDPEAGEAPPSDLVGLKSVAVMLPGPGDDALRSLWVHEDRARKRGAPEIAARIDEARKMLTGGGLVPVSVVLSDHDMASIRASGGDAQLVLLAAYLAGDPVRGKGRRAGSREPLAL